jgi:16S rRNA (adenine1518-N6/adenine1519-N6)-dimethyltransferase
MSSDKTLALDNLPTLKETIEQYGLLARKSLGQNFLLNMDVVRKVSRAAGDLSASTVIEIGPGPGGLTRALLEAKAQKVIAIERDERCIEALQTLVQASHGRLQLVSGDALEVLPQSLAEGPLKIVANLPYNIGTVLLTNWLKNLSRIESLTLMFQKEVALRLVAKPNTTDYGRLSILTQWLTQAQRVFDLPPGAFSPPPKVTSSVVHLIPRQLSQEELALFPWLEKITKAAFGQRRKMLRSSLKGLLTQEQLEALSINPEQRAETLLIKDFINLACFLKSNKRI